MTNIPLRNSEHTSLGPTDWYAWQGTDLLLRLRIQPRSVRDEFVGPQGAYYKVRITAPPVDDKANNYLIKYLAQAFGVIRSQVSLETGKTTRNKLIRIRFPQELPLPVARE